MGIVNEFVEHYSLYQNTAEYQERFVKGQESKTCRFCRKIYPIVTFRSVPHILPVLFGRNNCVSNFECDSCNARFQKYESDASTMMQHFLSLLSIKTKKGVPTFQSIKKDGKRPITVRAEGSRRLMNFDTNLYDFNYDEETRHLQSTSVLENLARILFTKSF